MSAARATAIEEEDAMIVSAAIAAGHDGEAELLLSVRYQNGVIGHVSMIFLIGLGRRIGIYKKYIKFSCHLTATSLN